MFEMKKAYLNTELIGQQMHNIVPQISHIKLILYTAILAEWPGELEFQEDFKCVFLQCKYKSSILFFVWVH